MNSLVHCFFFQDYPHVLGSNKQTGFSHSFPTNILVFSLRWWGSAHPLSLFRGFAAQRLSGLRVTWRKTRTLESWSEVKKHGLLKVFVFFSIFDYFRPFLGDFLLFCEFEQIRLEAGCFVSKDSTSTLEPNAVDILQPGCLMFVSDI